MKSTLRDARVDAAVKRANKPKPKRRVTPKPVEPSKYPRLAHNSAEKGTLVVRASGRLRGTLRALTWNPIVVGEVRDDKHLGRPDERVKKPGQHRRKIRKWLRENVVGKVAMLSKAATLKKGTRTADRRKALTSLSEPKG